MFSLPVEMGLIPAILVFKVTLAADSVSPCKRWGTGTGPESHNGEVMWPLPLCLPEAMSLVTPWRRGAAWGTLGQPTLPRTPALGCLLCAPRSPGLDPPSAYNKPRSTVLR